jgi:hypothetical protein
MRHILKIFSFVLTMLLVCNLTAQIEGVSYALYFNSSTFLYDCFLIIEKGETKSNLHRIQFNSQVSTIAPSGSKLEVSECFMPFIGNDNTKNRKSLEWMITDIVFASDEDSKHDYYNISPNVSQTSFYDNMSEGDKVRLFSIKAISNENEVCEIRLYENGVDRLINETDLSNGFSIGGANQLYRGIVKIENDEVSMYVQQEND